LDNLRSVLLFCFLPTVLLAGTTLTHTALVFVSSGPPYFTLVSTVAHNEPPPTKRRTNRRTNTHNNNNRNTRPPTAQPTRVPPKKKAQPQPQPPPRQAEPPPKEEVVKVYSKTPVDVTTKEKMYLKFFAPKDNGCYHRRLVTPILIVGSVGETKLFVSSTTKKNYQQAQAIRNELCGAEQNLCFSVSPSHDYHCLPLSSNFDSLLNDYKEQHNEFTSVYVSEVSCKNGRVRENDTSTRLVCEEFEVEGFPTLLWGKTSGVKPYRDQRLDYDSLRAFVNKWDVSDDDEDEDDDDDDADDDDDEYLGGDDDDDDDDDRYDDEL